MNLLSTLLSVLVPQSCITCGSLYTILCQGCAQKIRLYSPHCCFCQKTSYGGLSHDYCKGNTFCADFSIVLFYYSQTVRKLFTVFKYEEVFSVGEVFRDLILSYARADPFHLFESLKKYRRILILPVPMHWTKYWQRGFSPAEMVGRYVSDCLCKMNINSVFAKEILSKARTTRPQAGLSKSQRLLNQSKVFSIKNEQLSKEINTQRPDAMLVVDDVLSSGATVNSVVEVLKSSLLQLGFGEIPIGILAVARG